METNKSPKYLPSVGRHIGFAGMACNKLTQKLLDQQGLNLAHWVVLTALWRTEGMTISNLADYCKTNVPAASRTLDRMAREDLIERKTNPKDRRTTRIFLTRRAKDLSFLLALYEDVNDVLLDGFSDHEKEMFISLLERATKNAHNKSKALAQTDNK